MEGESGEADDEGEIEAAGRMGDAGDGMEARGGVAGDELRTSRLSRERLRGAGVSGGKERSTVTFVGM